MPLLMILKSYLLQAFFNIISRIFVHISTRSFLTSRVLSNDCNRCNLLTTLYAKIRLQHLTSLSQRGGNCYQTASSSRKLIDNTGRRADELSLNVSAINAQRRRQDLVRGAQTYMKLFVAHKMSQNNTLNKVHVAATESTQLLSQNTNVSRGDCAKSCQTLRSSKIN